MSSEDAAYLAGLVDGEAWIGIRTTQPFGTQRSRKHCLVVVLDMVDRQGADFCNSFTGNKTYIVPHQQHRTTYRSIITGRKAGQFLLSLLPQLKIKQNQAAVGIDFAIRCIGGRQGRPLSETDLTVRDHYWHLLKKLNCRPYDETKLLTKGF